MKHAMHFAPAALLAAGMFATPSQAHGVVTVGVGLPPVVIDTGVIQITIGEPPPPPPAPVVYVPEPQPERVVYVHRAPPPPVSTVVVYQRPRERVIYVDHRPCERDPRDFRGDDHRDNGYHGAKHRGHDKGNKHGDRGDGGYTQASHHGHGYSR